MKRIILFTLFLFFSKTLFCQSINWSAPLNVAPAQYGNNHPRIVLDGNGSPLILWGKSTTNEAWFSRWNGNAFTAPVILNPVTIPVFAASWAGPDIASFGDTIYVTYKHTPEDTNHIYITKSFDGGATFSSPVQVDNIGLNISRFPVVAVDSAGNPLVAFMHFEPMWMNPQYVVCRSSDFGNSFNTEVVASSFSGGQVCDCCPATLISAENFTTMLYRDNLNNIRNMWAGISTDAGTTFSNGIAIDQTNWFFNSCPSSGPDGFILDDSLYSVFMSAGTGNSLIYNSVFSLSNPTSGTSNAITGMVAGLNEQNFPRIAHAGKAAVISWVQTINNVDQLLFQYTDNIQNGFPTLIDTITTGNQLANTDVAISPGEIHLIWENSTTGTIKYQKGSYVTSNITSQSANSGIQLYPNPAGNFVNLKVENDNHSLIEINIFNINGQPVCHQNTFKNIVTINTLEFTSGIYAVQVTVNGVSSFKKLSVE